MTPGLLVLPFLAALIPALRESRPARFFALSPLESGVARHIVYNWLEHDQAFARQFDDTRQMATDVHRPANRQRRPIANSVDAPRTYMTPSEMAGVAISPRPSSSW